MMSSMTLSLPVEPAANELLSRSPLALLIAMLLDQQVPLEKAFSSPYQLTLRLGHEPTAQELAGFDPEALIAIFAERPALHRFPKAMAVRVQDLARQLIEHYDGDAEQVWATAASGAELRDRLARLPGFGAYKAQITMALLGKQLGVQPGGLARGGRVVRPRGLARLGGRHRGRGLPGPGPGLQEGGQGRRPRASTRPASAQPGSAQPARQPLAGPGRAAPDRAPTPGYQATTGTGPGWAAS